MERNSLMHSAESGYNVNVTSVYDPPSIEIVEFHLEKGFASSTEEWEGDSW